MQWNLWTLLCIIFFLIDYNYHHVLSLFWILLTWFNNLDIYFVMSTITVYFLSSRKWFLWNIFFLYFSYSLSLPIRIMRKAYMLTTIWLGSVLWHLYFNDWYLINYFTIELNFKNEISSKEVIIMSQITIFIYYIFIIYLVLINDAACMLAIKLYHVNYPRNCSFFPIFYSC